MKIAVTGARGQLGQDLVQVLSEKHEVHGFGRSEWDITSLAESRQQVEQLRPDVIVHSAAYTAVDQAEQDQDEAYKINAYGARNVAIAAQEIGAKLVYISTDYVFDGTSPSPYREFDRTNPLGVYGKSKLGGEEMVRAFCSSYFIVRTSWVYGVRGNNFVKTMLKLSREREHLKVVHDQIGSPTYTVDLCRFIEQLVESEHYGVYHASNVGSCSWYEFAKTIFEESGLSMQLSPCTTEEFPRPAPRPKNSVLEHMAIRLNELEDLPPWRDALRRFLKELQSVQKVDAAGGLE